MAAVGEQVVARANALAEGLYPHQLEGVAFLLGRRRALLTDDMGLGKTRQSIIALTEASERGPYLVVCPASLKRNWVREIEIVLPEPKCAIVGPADIHARTAADRFQPLQNLDRGSVVIAAGGRRVFEEIVGHACVSVTPQAALQAIAPSIPRAMPGPAP